MKSSIVSAAAMLASAAAAARPNLIYILNDDTDVLLGLDAETQGRCFKHFSAFFDDEIARDKSLGRYDDGVVDLVLVDFAQQ